MVRPTDNPTINWDGRASLERAMTARREDAEARSFRAYLHESMQSVYRAVAELVDGVRSVTTSRGWRRRTCQPPTSPPSCSATRRTPASATGTPSSSTASGGARSRSRSWRWSSSPKRSAQRPGTPRSRGGSRRSPRTRATTSGDTRPDCWLSRSSSPPRVALQSNAKAIESIPHLTAREVKTGKPARDARIFQEEHEKDGPHAGPH